MSIQNFLEEGGFSSESLTSRLACQMSENRLKSRNRAGNAIARIGSVVLSYQPDSLPFFQVVLAANGYNAFNKEMMADPSAFCDAWKAAIHVNYGFYGTLH